MLVYKINKGSSSDYCKSMQNLKEAYALWKNKNSNPISFALQRFVIPPSERVSKIRILFYVQKMQMLYKIISRGESISISPAPSSKRGWTRLRPSNSVERPLDAYEKYFVRGKEDDRVYEHEVTNLSLLEQMKSLRKVIELSECADGSYLLLEIVADFIQDCQGVFFFLNVVDYKTEFIVNKKPKTGLPAMRRPLHVRKRYIQTSGVEDNCESEEKLPKQLSTQNLISELIKELDSPKHCKTVTAESLYRKAYHLKS
jgi:hypothetical protein